MKSVDVLTTKYRVLVTEVLPYERPLRIDGDLFCRNMLEQGGRELIEKLFKEAGIKSDEWTIPFNYNVRKAGGMKGRSLSIPHPLIQLRWVDFYEKYDEYLIYLCSRSPFSIRYISRKSVCIVPLNSGIEDEDDNNSVEIDHLQNFDKGYRSYFSYKKYDMMYKFFDGGDYLRLEQKYPIMMRLDVAHCFYNIYTHSIAWAVKGKIAAKKQVGIQGTFEKELDILMQHANYNETLGIIVGSEFSRIFAEIIFQSIDLEVMTTLQNKGLMLGLDYEVRRYVDDYFLYAYSRDNLAIIKETLEEKLELYKLHINKSKEAIFERPFIADLNAAKSDVLLLMKQIRDLCKGRSGGEFSILQNVARQFRCIAARNHLQYGDLNRFFLSTLSKQIKRAMTTEDNPENLGLQWRFYTELSFFLFSLDMSHSASLKLCRILELLYQWSNGAEVVRNKIQRETKRILDIHVQMKISGHSNIEIINILMALKSLCYDQDILSPDILEKVYGPSSTWGYFQICTLLYLIRDRSDCGSIHKELECRIKEKLRTKEDLKYAENAYLWLDVVACPYLKDAFKSQIIKQVLDCKENKVKAKREEIKKYGSWFFNWSKSTQLSSFLEKREYSAPYE